jgi:hypothetical protein
VTLVHKFVDELVDKTAFGAENGAHRRLVRLVFIHRSSTPAPSKELEVLHNNGARPGGLHLALYDWTTTEYCSHKVIRGTEDHLHVPRPSGPNLQAFSFPSRLLRERTIPRSHSRHRYLPQPPVYPGALS